MPLVCCGVLCLCFWLVFILYVLYCSNVAIWEEVILNVKYMHEQFPALCYHGRDKGSSFADASFTIDDTRMKRSDYNLSQGPYSGPGSYANRPDLAMCSASDPSDSQCQMQCQWEISVYPCLDKDVDVETFQHCKSDYTDDVWEVRPVQKTWVGEFDWRCWGNGVREEGYSSACSATSWDCDGTPCDADAHAARLCVQEMEPRPYSCWYAPRDDDLPLREPVTSYPYLAIVAAIVVTCCVDPCFVPQTTCSLAGRADFVTELTAQRVHNIREIAVT